MDRSSKGATRRSSNTPSSATSCCGLSRLRQIFVCFVLTAFISIVIFSLRKQHVSQTLYVRVPENRDVVVNMNQSELSELARKTLMIKTGTNVVTEKANNVNVSTKATSNISDIVSVTISTELPRGTVPASDIIQPLIDAYNFVYGDSKPISSFDNKTACPAIPPGLAGEIKVFQDYYPMQQLNSLGFRVQPGGSYTPPDCQPKQNVAIIIPFRNREKHLSVLLLNLHPFLQKQQLSYTIFIVNQVPGSKFNRALLMNIGYWEAMRQEKFDCLVFHDVDLLPHNDRNIYTCPDNGVRHMSAYIDKFKYSLPYNTILGGVVAIRSELFLKVNGYSNQFFGWGGEDDDFSERCRRQGVQIVRFPKSIARYKMIRHELDSGNEANPGRFEMLKNTGARQTIDGINTLTYNLTSIVKMPLYTRINAAIDQTHVMNAEPRDSLPPFITGLSNETEKADDPT